MAPEVWAAEISHERHTVLEHFLCGPGSMGGRNMGNGDMNGNEMGGPGGDMRGGPQMR